MRYLTMALLALTACADDDGVICTDRDTSNRLGHYVPAGASECVTELMLVSALYDECTTRGYPVPTAAEAEAACQGDHGFNAEPWCWDIYLRSTCHEMAQPQGSPILATRCQLFSPADVLPSCAAAE